MLTRLDRSNGPEVGRNRDVCVGAEKMIHRPVRGTTETFTNRIGNPSERDFAANRSGWSVQAVS